MKVKKILGTEKIYIFEDDEIVPFWDSKRYKEKLAEGKQSEPIEDAPVEEVKKTTYKRRGRRKKT